MAVLYLQCAICGRRQAGGLLSAAAWGVTRLPEGVASDHPAISDSSVRACPTCIGRDAQWETTARAAVGAA